MAIKHVPKFYVRLCTKTVNFPENFLVYSGSIYGRYTEDGKPVFWVCDNYTTINGKLPVHIYMGKIPKIDRENLRHKDYENLMKHDSLHKKGTGCRINTHQINQPLKWREVTEYAHWNGKGNASVVASNIR